MIFIFIALLIVFGMYKFFTDRDKMLDKQLTPHGGIINKYSLFIEYVMALPNAKIASSSRATVHIRSVYGLTLMDFYIDETFNCVVIDWRANLGHLGKHQKVFEFPNNYPQNLMIQEIENYQRTLLTSIS